MSRATVSREWQRWAARHHEATLAAPVAAAVAAIAAEQLVLDLSPTESRAQTARVSEAEARVTTEDAATGTDRATAVGAAPDAGTTAPGRSASALGR